ncbi:MAG: serine/threonine-protein kinase RsbW [Solirubrobacterales bacterium]|jgi:anti-sigma regulatory factor (Ser/Thr protein kinase)|nr:serine/threonine-protein kinase RsbW [Solirubrobacterales bacterium]
MLAMRGEQALQREDEADGKRLHMNERPTGLQIKLPAKAENVAVVRHALAGLAEQIGMDETGVADLKTVVTEACMNVVVHAYPDGLGPLMVDADPDTEGLTVTVSDRGSGISPQADSERSSLKLGLSLIAALSSSFRISGGLDRGTEVMMRLPLTGGGANGAAPAEEEVSVAVDATELTVARAELLEPVLARLVGALAARRELSIERVSDAVLITDAIADAAPERFADGCVRLGLGESEKGLELRLGPMEDGAGGEIRQKLEVPEVGGSLEGLVDEVTVEKSDEGDYLIVRFTAVPGA